MTAAGTFYRGDDTIVTSETYRKIHAEIFQMEEAHVHVTGYPRNDTLLCENHALEKHDFIDSTSMMLHYGRTVHTVQGPAENIKVTTPADFYICRALLDAREESQIYGL